MEVGPESIQPTRDVYDKSSEGLIQALVEISGEDIEQELGQYVKLYRASQRGLLNTLEADRFRNISDDLYNRFEKTNSGFYMKMGELEALLAEDTETDPNSNIAA